MIEAIDKTIPEDLKNRIFGTILNGQNINYKAYPYDICIRNVQDEKKSDYWLPLLQIWRNEAPELADSSVYGKFNATFPLKRDTSGTYPYQGTEMMGEPGYGYDLLLTYTVNFISKSLKTINAFVEKYFNWRFQPHVIIDYSSVSPGLVHKCYTDIDNLSDNSDVSRFYEEGEFFRYSFNFVATVPVVFAKEWMHLAGSLKITIQSYYDE